MHLHLTLSQLTLLVGIAIAVAMVLVLLIYFFHRAAKEQTSGAGFEAGSPRTENESAFIAATFQGVIADLKSRQRDLETRLRSAEEQARRAQRTLDALAAELPQGLLVISRDGFITRANDAVRELVAIDLWSRRPYWEIFGAGSPLATLIQNCIETGKPLRQTVTLGPMARQPEAQFEVSAAPIESGSHAVAEGVVCLLRQAGPI